MRIAWWLLATIGCTGDESIEDSDSVDSEIEDTDIEDTEPPAPTARVSGTVRKADGSGLAGEAG